MPFWRSTPNAASHLSQRSASVNSQPQCADHAPPEHLSHKPPPIVCVSLSMRVVSVVLNPQPTLPAPKAHVSVLPDNLPCFAKRKARHLKKLETIQRRLAWPPRRDDIANTEMVRAFCFRCTVFRIATKRIEKLRIARFLSALSSGSFKMRQQHDPHMTRFVMRLFVPC